VFCNKCGMEVASTYKICPKCGANSFVANRPANLLAPQPQPQASAGIHQSISAPLLSPSHPVYLSNHGVRTLVVKIGVVLLALVIALSFVRYWENAKAEAEVRRQEELARIAIEKQRKEMELELERRKREEIEAQERELARQNAENARIRAEADRQNQIMKDAISSIEVSTRGSFLKDYKGTKVLNMYNTRDFTVSFSLKCCTVQNSCYTYHFEIEANGSRELGFIQGWTGNFLKGEYCMALHDNETLWKVTF